MRVACVDIDHFAAAVETRERQELLSRPLVIGGLPADRKPVFECSCEAAILGIGPGMPLRQAHHICPDAVFIPLDISKYARAFDEVLDALERFSPTVETICLGRAALDITGTERLFGSEIEIAARIASEIYCHTCLNSRIGIAGNKFVASVAATMASSQHPQIIEPSEEKGFLGDLSIQLLPVSEDMKGRLELLGLCAMGQVGSLSLDELANQFGIEGILAHQLANGKDERPLTPRARPAVLEQGLSIESPLETVEALLMALDGLLDKLIPVLRNRNQVCGQVRLRFRFDGVLPWHENITLKEPTDSKRAILSLLKHRVGSLHLPADVTGICLAFSQLGGEPARQDPLFSRENRRQKEQLKRVARGLRTRFGSNPIKQVAEIDPDSRVPERRSVLIDFGS